jgi:hypothetical protein
MVVLLVHFRRLIIVRVKDLTATFMYIDRKNKNISRVIFFPASENQRFYRP